MAYQQQPQQQPQAQPDIVSGEQYRYALTNFRIAHEKVEQQRQQLEQQERQVAELRARISLLEGGSTVIKSKNSTNSVDDFSIKNAAARLDKIINRWAADIIRAPPTSLELLNQAIMNDISVGPEVPVAETSPMKVQSLLRHAMSEIISEGIINCLLVTNSPEANAQLTHIHDHLFARDPTVASVWRRQTYSAAVEEFTPEMTQSILQEHVPNLMALVGDKIIPSSGSFPLLDSAYDFSRMLHGSSPSSSGAMDAFYRAFIPDIGSVLHQSQVELVKRCLRVEKGDIDRVGAIIFPGLIKVSRGPLLPNGQRGENTQTVVRRAQAICECALLGSINANGY